MEKSWKRGVSRAGSQKGCVSLGGGIFHVCGVSPSAVSALEHPPSVCLETGGRGAGHTWLLAFGTDS